MYADNRRIFNQCDNRYFDRIREEPKTKKNAETQLDELVNKCITFDIDTKCLYITYYICYGSCFIYHGVSSIREFALPLMVGIICGAYSSVCITGALWYVMKTKIGVKKAGRK